MDMLNLSALDLLTTTRSVRQRLDLTRAVPTELIRQCIEIALQAPSGSNSQRWHFVVIMAPRWRPVCPARSPGGRPTPIRRTGCARSARRPRNG